MSIAHWYSQYEQQLQRSLQLWISSADGHICSSWVCSLHVQRSSTLSSCSIFTLLGWKCIFRRISFGAAIHFEVSIRVFQLGDGFQHHCAVHLYLNPLSHPRYPRVEPAQVICLPFFQHPSANLVIGLMMLSVRCNCSLQNKLLRWRSWIGFEPI